MLIYFSHFIMLLFLCLVSIRDKLPKDEKGNIKQKNPILIYQPPDITNMEGKVVLSALFQNLALSTVQTDLYHTQKTNTEQTNQHTGLWDAQPHCSQWISGVRDVHFWEEAPDSLDITLFSYSYRALNEGISKVHRNSALPQKPDQ